MPRNLSAGGWDHAAGRSVRAPWLGWSLTVAGCVCLAIGPAFAEDWPQFRGPDARGVSEAERPLPTEFSLEQNLLWSVELGPGIASPVISGQRVITTAMSGAEEFAVIALDRSTGRELWRRAFATGPLPAITLPNNHASSTPATDGRRVFVHFCTLGLLALDIETGEVAWQLKLDEPHYLMDWGAAASPIVYDNLVIFCQDDDLSPFLIAVDSQTGRIRWRTERPEMLAGYALPVICEVAGRHELIVAGTGKLKGYDPATGQELWTCNTLVRTIMTSPVVRDGVIYISVQSYGDTDRVLKSALLEWKDTNQDGVLARDEVPPAFAERFAKGDANGDGRLEGDEIDRAFQAPSNMVGGGSIIQAIRAGGSGDVTATHLLWNLKNRAPSNLASPLLVGDQLFVVKRGGLSSSFDAATGEKHWEIKRINNLGEYYASPVAGDGKIYVTGENGFVVVLAAGAELQILAKNDLGGTCIATPAIADGRLYFRTTEKLLCFGLK
ncbi:MAG: PQQ-binding-like beta-propeller repeat protein [Pirellulales bacterium]